MKELEEAINYLENLNNVTDAEEAISEIEKLGVFFEGLDNNNVSELIFKLFKDSDIFNKLVQMVYDKYYLKISNKFLRSICNNNFLYDVIESYIINNYELKNISTDYDLESDKAKVPDEIREYIKNISKIKLLSEDEEKELLKKVATGDKSARKRVIESNLKLVVWVAKKYYNRGLDFFDLIQEGNIGLMRAVDKYDITFNNKFSTYATWWIRQSIIRALHDKSKTIRIPVYLSEKNSIIKKSISKLSNELGRIPSIEEISKETNFSVSDIKKYYELQNNVISLNENVGDDKDTEFGDFVPSKEESLEEIVIKSELKENINILLKKCNLSDREIDIILSRNGILTGEEVTLEELGKKYNISRERIRQIEFRAERKLINSENIKDYIVYLQCPGKALKNIGKLREKYNKLELYENEENIETERKSMRKIKTIYEILGKYTKEQVDNALKKLSEEEYNIIKLRYGSDLHNPLKTSLSEEESKQFYNGVLPKIKRIIANTEKNNIENNHSISKDKIAFQDEKNEVIKKVEEKKLKSESENLNELNNENNLKINEINNNQIVMDKNDCIKILELIKNKSLIQMTDIFSLEELVIIILKLGYINGKYFSTSSIANFLDIEEVKIDETIKKLLLTYKDNINSFIDNIIDVVSDNSDNKKYIIKRNLNN